ncbi:ABC transporter permease subunit [Eggerthellaceae bacterium zg-887]|uniref:ABC transporter permease n=1 Tax=Xiamenia xianingshaonis TaxID=2682776 RepID=UPI00140C0117|nr:ABC transporter permease subunit [Xiamenia xianingshaonis]NHM15585.1 ABC transporter permease subunit [Xiamenia xianingshaonis]
MSGQKAAAEEACTAKAGAEGPAGSGERPRRRHRRKRNGAAWALVALQALCVVGPVAIIALWAFTSSWPWPLLFPETFTTRGIEELFGPSQRLGEVLATSVGIALACALLTVVVATMAAAALSRYRFRGRDVARFAVLVPFLIPATVFAMGVQVAFLRAGLSGTVVGVVICHAIVALPYAALIMVDAMQAAGSRLEDQARLCGAGPVRVWTTVTVPTLAPALLSAASMSYILSFSQYFLTLLVGAGKVKTLALVMFPYLSSGDRTIASAYGIVFLAATLAVFLLFEVLLRRQVSREIDYFNG